MGKKNRQRIEELERRIDYLEAMLRNHIALAEQGKGTLTPFVPLPYYPDSGSTPAPLLEPLYRLTCSSHMTLADESMLATTWLAPEDNHAWSEL